jgi:uncharacterized protein YoaH (UPF0181 family)
MEDNVFKKFITMMMVVSFFTVNAQAVTQNGLKAAFDELNYALTVEWDQKDQDFYTEQMKQFSAQIRELQAKGMTNAQLIAFVKSEVKDAKVARDLETAFNMISINKMNSEEASKYMVETMKKSYSAGASWNGEAIVYLAVGVLFVAAAIAIANGNYSSSGTYYCTDYYVCRDYCYYDYYWGYTCYQDCYWTCY